MFDVIQVMLSPAAGQNSRCKRHEETVASYYQTRRLSLSLQFQFNTINMTPKFWF